MAKRASAVGPVDGPWVLPDGWRWCRLGDLGEFLNGAAFKPTDWGDFGTPIIRIQNLNNPDRAMNRTARTVNQRLMVRAGDLLVSWSATLDAFLWRREDAWLNQHIFKVIPDETLVDRGYMFFLLKNEIENLKKTEHLHGSTMMHINRGPFLAHPVPVPPIETQRVVATRIDELFADIDDGEAALTRARDDLATWRKALLKAAVTGELTVDWRAANPPTESGADFLARILADRRARWEAVKKNRGKQYKEPSAAMGGTHRDLPDGWTWASVEQIGEVITGNTPPASDATAYAGKIPFFTPGDLDAGFALDQTKRTLGPSGLAKSRYIPARSVLVTCIGATIGKVGFNARAGASNQQINAIVPATEELAEFVFYYFDGPGRQLVVDGASSTTMPIINKGDFSRLALPVPPVEEAQEIGRRVMAKYADADSAVADMSDVRVAASTLRQSILAAAFRGDLT